MFVSVLALLHLAFCSSSPLSLSFINHASFLPPPCVKPRAGRVGEAAFGGLSGVRPRVALSLAAAVSADSPHVCFIGRGVHPPHPPSSDVISAGGGERTSRRPPLLMNSAAATAAPHLVTPAQGVKLKAASKEDGSKGGVGGLVRGTGW